MYVLFIGKDKENMAELRQQTRPRHRAYIYSTQEPARLVYGAPLADAHGEMTGTMLLIEADTLADAQAFIKGDPYSEVGLFGETRLEILHQAAPVPALQVAE